ncbi:MAG: hypothetical protein Q4E12_05645 [Coriobacteriia bacterium]|nr:hypothetical protein [Coriobacteriia bacterium]
MEVRLCPSCSAALSFDPATGQLHCQYCDTFFPLEDAPYHPGPFHQGEAFVYDEGGSA